MSGYVKQHLPIMLVNHLSSEADAQKALTRGGSRLTPRLLLSVRELLQPELWLCGPAAHCSSVWQHAYCGRVICHAEVGQGFCML